MKYLMYISIIISILSCNPNPFEKFEVYPKINSDCNCGDYCVDTRDTSVFLTAKIGGLCWMAENLNFGVSSSQALVEGNHEVVRKYCYTQSPDSCDVYGGFYNYRIVSQGETSQIVQGICPPGFRIPTIQDYQKLVDELGNNPTSYIKDHPNSMGFDAVLLGWFYAHSGLTGARQAAFWTSTPSSQGNYVFVVGESQNIIELMCENCDFNRTTLVNCRCVRDL